MKYCNVKRPMRSIARMSRASVVDCATIFTGGKDDEAELIGTKILRAVEFGGDIGTTVPVVYDTEDDGDNVDVTSSPNHDIFDIAEEFGKTMERSAPPASDGEKTE